MAGGVRAAYPEAMQNVTPPVDDFIVREPPFYVPQGDEVDVFLRAHAARLPVLIKGPTGCGKTRFVAHMAHRLGRPLMTVACHEDLSASDLVGRYLLLGDQTVWMDGPLTAGVRHGGIVYLDEVVEARKDTLVVIHPLTDDRRILPIDRLATVLRAPDAFMMVVSYNPGYQSVLKELKPSTKQRFVTIELGYPSESVEARVLVAETGIDEARAGTLVRVGAKIRNLASHGLDEGVSTRLLVYAARLMVGGLAPEVACRAAFSRSLTEDRELQASLDAVVADFF